jgi:hypothetical protein
MSPTKLFSIFSSVYDAASDTTSQVLLISITLQLLAGNGNGLVPLQQLGPDAAPDMPVKLGEFGIDRKGRPLAGRMNQLAYLG